MTNSFEPADNNTSHQPNIGDKNLNLIGTGDRIFWFDQGFTWLVYTFAAITVAVLFLMSLVIFHEAQPAIFKFGLGFLWSKDWDTGNKLFGALPYIYGTFGKQCDRYYFHHTSRRSDRSSHQ